MIDIPIEQLKPNPANPHQHNARQIEKVANLIKKYGWRHPIIISNQSGLIDVGHCRLEAAKLLGQTTVPVEYQDFSSPDIEYGFMIADNSASDGAEFDFDMINIELPNLGPEFDIKDLGFNDFKLDASDKPEKRKRTKVCPNCGAEL